MELAQTHRSLKFSMRATKAVATYEIAARSSAVWGERREWRAMYKNTAVTASTIIHLPCHLGLDT